MKALKKIILILVFLLISVSIPVFAGPPFLADDPEPVEYRHQKKITCEIFAYLSFLERF